MHGLRWITVLCAAALLVQPTLACAWLQRPAAPPPPSAPDSQSPTAVTSKPGKKKYSHMDDFLIRGTVFNDKALSFPGVRLRIRRKGEKRFRWENYSNSRGEFALRVPQGSDYEMVVSVKGFREQTRTIDAKNGENEASLMFGMQPAAGDKK